MQCPRDNFRKSLDLAEDGVGGGGPLERTGVAVVMFCVSVDALDEFLDVAEGTTAD